VGSDSDAIKIHIGPGEEQFIELKAMGSNWSIQTSVSYSIH
jgi:hypothetical protein